MGRIMYRGKSCDNVVAVRLGTAECGRVTLSVVCSNGVSSNMFVDAKRLQVGITGGVQNLDIANAAYVFGNVSSASVGNCMYVEGFVKEFTNIRGILVDKTVNVKRELDETLDKIRKASGKFTNLLIEGVATIDLGACALTVVPVVRGNVGQFRIGNCVWIRGTVDRCNVGNAIHATMGLKESKEELRRKEEQRRRQQQLEQDLLSSLDDLFKRY